MGGLAGTLNLHGLWPVTATFYKMHSLMAMHTKQWSATSHRLGGRRSGDAYWDSSLASSALWILYFLFKIRKNCVCKHTHTHTTHSHTAHFTHSHTSHTCMVEHVYNPTVLERWRQVGPWGLTDQPAYPDLQAQRQWETLLYKTMQIQGRWYLRKDTWGDLRDPEPQAHT